jgi:hypothetical protein
VGRVVVKRRSGGLISALPISFLSAFGEKGVVSSFFESVFCTGDRGWFCVLKVFCGREKKRGGEEIRV